MEAELAGKISELGQPPPVRTQRRLRMGRRWTRAELREEFEVDHASPYPYVIVTRKEDGVTGTVRWDAGEEMYYGFERVSELPPPEL